MLTESNSYLTFSWVRFIKGIITNTTIITKTLFTAITSDAYMSTRISPKSEFNWTVAGNTNIARERAEALLTEGITVLNPVDLQMKNDAWSGYEYLTFWNLIIRMMNKLNKSMVSFNEDLVGSKGCTYEVQLANKIGMKVISK